MARAYHYTHHSAVDVVVRAQLVGGGPYDGRSIDRRGDLPEEITLQWPSRVPSFGAPDHSPRYCTYRREAGTSRYRFQGPTK